MMRQRPQWSVLSVLIRVLCVVLIVYLVAAGAASVSWDHGEVLDQMIQVKQASLAVDEVESLRVVWFRGNVRIVPSDQKEITVIQRSNRTLEEDRTFGYTLEKGLLNITQADTNWSSLFSFLRGNWSTSLEISLPNKLYRQVKVEMTSGEMDIQNLRMEEGRFRLTSGTGRLQSLKADALTMELTSGSMQLTDSTAGQLVCEQTSGRMSAIGSFDAIEVEATSGRFDVSTLKLPHSLKIEMTSGKGDITLPTGQPFSLRYQKTAGDIDSDFFTLESGKKGTASYLSGGPVFEAELTSGQLHFLQGELQ